MIIHFKNRGGSGWENTAVCGPSAVISGTVLNSDEIFAIPHDLLEM